ncbi:TPA: hypothetical protein I8W54_003690 [Morganella morganii]|nr:hypothetical protein [Morganella morganii]
MTVSTELSHEEYTGNGVTTDFDFRFRIFEAKHLVVSVADQDGAERILTNGTDYTLRGVGSYRGGKVILKMPLATGWKIGIARDLPAVQETDLRNQGKFFAEVHEDAFDYLTMLIQKSLGFLSLCLRKPSFISDHYDAKGNKISNLGKPVKDGDAVNLGTMNDRISAIDRRSLRVTDKDIPALPNTANRANKLLSFDNDGNPKLVLPESGSATDVLIELGKPTGANLIGTSGGKTVQKELDDINTEVFSFNEKRNNFFQFKQQRNFNNNMFGQLQEGQDGVFHYAPTVTVLPSGRIISVYTVKTGKAIDPGQDATPMYLQCAISDDDGETWTKKDLVNKGAGYATSESVLVHSKIDGNLYCFYTSMKGATGWGKSEQGFDENNASQIEYVFSSDNGKTWSEPVNITRRVKPVSAFLCSIAPTQCGYMKDKLIIPFYYLKEKNNGITECYITLDTNRIADFGEIVRDEYQDDTPGRSGGEIGFGNFSSGELFAIERAFDDTTKSFRIAQQKLLVKDRDTDKWIVKGQFATSDCQASFIRVGLDYGFDKEYLFVVAPVGITGQLDGRQNMRIFDCSDDFSNPKDLALIAVQANVAAEYSSTQLLPTGAFISLWHGRQYTIQSSLYTINRKRAGRYLSMPSHTGYKIIDTSSGSYSYDLFDGELVKNKKSPGFSEYSDGAFHDTNSVKVKTIREKLIELNADEAGMFVFNVGSDSSAIGEIKGGYVGMVITLMVASSTVAVELVREKSGAPLVRRVMFSDSVDGSKYKMTGGTGARSSVVKLTKTDSGWYLDRPANSN